MLPALSERWVLLLLLLLVRLHTQDLGPSSAGGDARHCGPRANVLDTKKLQYSGYHSIASLHLQ